MQKKIKKNFFLISFILVNITFIFLQIHKQSIFIKLNYENQKLEKEMSLLNQKKNNLIQKLHQLKHPTNIKNYAMNKLGMQKLKINQIKKLND